MLFALFLCFLAVMANYPISIDASADNRDIFVVGFIENNKGENWRALGIVLIAIGAFPWLIFKSAFSFFLNLKQKFHF